MLFAENPNKLENELHELNDEVQEIDKSIAHPQSIGEFEVQRLKHKRRHLQERISVIMETLYPDIIA